MTKPRLSVIGLPASSPPSLRWLFAAALLLACSDERHREPEATEQATAALVDEGRDLGFEGPSTTGSAGAGSGGVSGSPNNAGAGAVAAGSTPAGSDGSTGTDGSLAGVAEELFIQLPNGVATADVVLASYGGPLVLGDEVKVRARSGAFASVSSVNASSQTELGARAELFGLKSQAAVFLRNHAVVHGDLITESTLLPPQLGARVDGNLIERASLTPIHEIRWAVAFPSGPALSLEPSDGEVIAPGAYAGVNLKSGAHLVLSPGTYTFDGPMTLEPGSRLEMQNDAPVQLYVREGLTFRGSIVKSEPRANVLIGVLGAGAIPIEQSFDGVLVAPRADVTLGSVPNGHRGSFFAKSILVGPHVTLTHDSADPEELCPVGAACSALCPCDGPGGGCSTDADCDAGSICGENNGACFGSARADRVCWPAECETDARVDACGASESPCGRNCACVNSCDSTNPESACPPGEVCKPGAGSLFGAPSPDACVDVSCPSNDPSLCGGVLSLCGSQCVCTPDCSGATCAEPSDGCGGICTGSCPLGTPGCTDDLQCPFGATCQKHQDGSSSCRPRSCAERVLVPPLCGMPDSVCAEQCPTCTPHCDGRVCGLDPNCGTSCGSCAQGSICSADGQCVTPTTDPPPTVPDGQGGEVPLEDLPPLETTGAGALSGTFAVSEHGAAEYTVPIEVPPGRGGMMPALSLKYAGSRENGDLGIGWRLEGLSKITRCPRTYALDGYAAPVKNDPSDRFCIDGKRLAGVSGTYGAHEAEYRTVIDSFAKIQSRVEPGSGLQTDPWTGIERVAPSFQGPDSFKVWTKDGRILTFGGSIDAMVLGRNGVRHAWLLRRVEDRSGNTIVVRYENFGSRLPPGLHGTLPNVVRPSIIAYTGHGSVAGDREVRFSYEAREDVALRYLQGGVGWLIAERLSRITTFVKGEAVKTYRLEYGEAADSQIERIFECEALGDTVCKAPTRFTYASESGFTFQPVSIDLVRGAELDVNGDGIPDYLKTVKTVDGVDAQPALIAAQIAADVTVGVASSFATPAVGVAITVVWTVVKPAFWGIFADEPVITVTRDMLLGTGSRVNPTTDVRDINGVPCTSRASAFLDFDADGRHDVIAPCLAGQLRLALSTGDGNFRPFPIDGSPLLTLPIAGIPDAHAPPGVHRTLPGPAPVIYDIDGDSLQDIVSCADRHTLEVRRRLDPTLGFAEPIRLETPEATLPGMPRQVHPLCGSSRPTHNIFDLDGDGTPDLLARGETSATDPWTGSTDGWQVLRFVHDGGGARVEWRPVPFPDVAQSEYGKGLSLADFNGDGLVDVWKAEGDEGVVWLNTGNSAFVTRRLFRPRPALEFEEPFQHLRSAAIDYDSDGRTDLIENWGRGLRRFNVALLPNPSVTALSYVEAEDLKGRDDRGFAVHWGFVKSSDVDADGNRDLFGEGNGVFYGSGARNRLLTRVEDALGRFTAVSYDAADTYRHECTGPAWPETCLKRMTGLVSGYVEGFVDSQGRDVTERHFSHTYVNARMNVTGHGFLGFDKRTIRETAGVQTVRSISIEYEPTARFTPGGVQTDATAPPYVYLLAGMPRVVITDREQGDSTATPPLQKGIYARRSRVENFWRAGVSATGQPFPKLRFRRTRIYDRRVPGPFEPALPDEGDGTMLTQCEEDFAVDSYGNVTRHEELCGENLYYFAERSETVHQFSPDPSTWLISNPELITLTHSREGNEQSQEWDPSYDTHGRLLTMRRSPSGPASERHTTTYGRDVFGNVETVTETDSTGEAPRTTSISYDGSKVFPVAVINAKGHASHVRFDPRFGTPKVLLDPNGIAVRHLYDGLGSLRETRDPTGITAYGYQNVRTGRDSSAGRIEPRLEVSIEHQGTDGTPGGGVVQELDYLGRVLATRSQGFAGAEVLEERTYDVRGRLASATLPHTAGAEVIPSMIYSYDGFDRLTRIDRSDGTFIENQYASRVSLNDALQGWYAGVTCGTTPLGSCAIEFVLSIDEEETRSARVLDHRGFVRRSIDGEGDETDETRSDYLYGAFGRLLEARDGGGAITRFAHDPYGRLLSHTDPDSGLSTNTYNGYDELETSTNAAGEHRTYTYDTLGRIQAILDSQGSTLYTYDDGPNALGRLSETVSPSTLENPEGQRVRYGYEPPSGPNNRGFLNRLEYVIDGVNYPVHFTLDSLGRPDRISYPNLGNGAPITVQHHYDPSGILSGIDEVGGASPRPFWRLNDAREGHLLARETFGNGATTSYTYHPHRRFLETIETKNGADTLQSLRYTHYDNGLIDQRIATTAGATTERQHLYDALNRIQVSIEVAGPGAVTPTAYAYDAHGNLARRGGLDITPVPNQPHLIASVGENQYQYDAAGRVKGRTGSAVPGEHQAITYTPFDLPHTVSTGTGASAFITRFEYTADGARIVRRDLDATRYFVPDLYERLATPTGTTLEERFRVHAGDRVLGEIVRKNGTDQTLYFHTDALDSVDTITTDSRVALHQTFDIFGAPLSAPSPELPRAGFTGHAHDRDLGLVDMRGRVYDPLAGRFMTADPVMQAPHSTQGLNRYSYVFNDPVNNVDPSGYFAILPGYPAGAVITGGGGLAAGLGGNVGSTFGGGLQGLGSTGHGPRAIAAGAVAPSAGGVGQATTHAVGQNKGGVGPRTGAGRPGGSSLAKDPAVLPGQQCLTDERCDPLIPIVPQLGQLFAELGAAWRWLFTPAPEVILSNQAAGKIIGWPTGQAAAGRTLDMARKLTAEQVAAMRAKGLNRATVEHLRETYQKAIEAGGAKLRNEQLLPRKQLMDRILELWPN